MLSDTLLELNLFRFSLISNQTFISTLDLFYAKCLIFAIHLKGTIYFLSSRLSSLYHAKELGVSSNQNDFDPPENDYHLRALLKIDQTKFTCNAMKIVLI